MYKKVEALKNLQQQLQDLQNDHDRMIRRKQELLEEVKLIGEMLEMNVELLGIYGSKLEKLKSEE